MPSTLLTDMLAQQLMGFRIENADVKLIPLHVDVSSDPAGWCAVEGGFDFYAAIQMHRSFPVLVITKRFERQRQQRRFFFGKHRRDLPLGGAMDACVGPPGFPVIEIALGFGETFETLSF